MQLAGVRQQYLWRQEVAVQYVVQQVVGGVVSRAALWDAAARPAGAVRLQLAGVVERRAVPQQRQSARHVRRLQAGENAERYHCDNSQPAGGSLVISPVLTHSSASTANT